MARSDGSEPQPVCCDGGVSTPTTPVRVASETELEEAIAEYEVVLAEFHADWCGPCEQLAPILENVARDTHAVVAKIDVETNRELAFAHRIRSVPTMELYTAGNRVERLVGGRTEDAIRDLIRSHRRHGSG